MIFFTNIHILSKNKISAQNRMCPTVSVRSTRGTLGQIGFCALILDFEDNSILT